MSSQGSKRYRKGAFIAHRQKQDSDEQQRVVIPFRFNPETLSRTLRIQQGQSRAGTNGASGTKTSKKDAGANASSGELTHSFSVLVRVDFHDRYEASQKLDPKYGVLPELSVLESLLYDLESPEDYPSDGTEPVRQRPLRPSVLFYWGKERIFPVRITGMTIDETLFNEHLNPTRAEIDVQLEVLGGNSAPENPTAREAWKQLSKNREKMADMYRENTADQGEHFPEL